jgi:hypothetical protein
MRPIRFLSAYLLLAGLAFIPHPAAGLTIDFEDLSPSPFWHGPELSVSPVPGPYPDTDLYEGSFTSGGATFVNRYLDGDFPSWSGFAYSRVTDSTTPGFGSQHNAYPGAGHGPSTNYGVGFGYRDLVANIAQSFNFDPNNPAHLVQLPYFDVPAGYRIQSLYAANTTYGALTMRDGDVFGFAKQFNTTDGDWAKLTAYGTNALGQPLGVSVDFYLADYRVDDEPLTTWELMDLTPLADARRIYLNFYSTDVGIFGLNTPASYAIDNIELAAETPEPGTLVLLGVGGAALAALGIARRRRRDPARRN